MQQPFKPETLDDDLESGTTTCWALKNGGVQLSQIAVDDSNQIGHLKLP